MSKFLSVLLFSIFFIANDCSNLYGQVVELGCQDHDDAFIGLDRKNWNGGSTANHSEGMMLNFVLPEKDGCQQIEEIDIDITVFLVDDSGLQSECGGIAYYVNMYAGCGDFAPASCPESNIIDEPNSPNFNSQNYNFNSANHDFQFGDTLGIDVVPAIGNTGCPNGQTAITSGDIVLEYEVCVTVTLIEEEISMPLDLGEDLSVCPGETVEIDGGSAYTSYEWFPNGDTTQSIIVGVGSYSLLVTDENGCEDIDFINVEEIELELNIETSTGANQICQGDTIELEAISNVGDILWSTGDTTQVITVGAGTYSVTVTNSEACSATEVIEIIESVPDLTIVTDDEDFIICEGVNITLEADTQAPHIEWSTGDTSHIITIGAGLYTVTVTDINGCTNSQDIEVIESNPMVSIESNDDDNLICEGENVSLEAITDETDILWSNGESGSIIEVGPGTYGLTVTDVSGCTSESSITIDIQESIETTLQTTLCSGESVIVNGTEYLTVGTYFQEFTSQAGCDSLVIIEITPEIGCNDCMPRPEDDIILGMHKIQNDLYKINISGRSIQLNKNQLTALISYAELSVQTDNKQQLINLLQSENLVALLKTQDNQTFSKSYQFVQEARNGARLNLSFKFHK